MEHLLNISVYDLAEDLQVLKEMKPPLEDYIDGIELLTGYTPVDPSLKKRTVTVHLPYATDFRGIWTGKRSVEPGLSDTDIVFRHYGRNRQEIVENIRLAIRMAAPLEPVVGVIHGGCSNINEMLCCDYSDDSEECILVFCEMMNEVMKGFPGGEPPFTLVIENTWWPGFRAMDDSEYRLLRDNLDFDDWGICLDTGHLLVATQESTDEATALKVLNRIVDGYSDEMIGRIYSMHLQLGTSAHAIRNCAEPDYHSSSDTEMIEHAYPYIGIMDPHQPWTMPGIRDLVERIQPDIIVHELVGRDLQDQISRHICQRSHFL